MTIDEEITKLDLIASDAFEGGDANEFRQLAEWLKELKEIKHLFSVTEKLFKANFRGGLIDVVDGYDILFSEHKQLREIFEEVNADE